MSIMLIVNRKTDERGYQARWRGKTAYFSARRHGEKEAKELAISWEAKFREANPSREMKGVHTRGHVRRNPGPVGYQFIYMVRTTENVYAHIAGSYRNRLGKMSGFDYSIDKHGVDEACRLAHEKRTGHGYPSVTVEELITFVKQWLADTTLPDEDEVCHGC